MRTEVNIPIGVAFELVKRAKCLVEAERPNVNEPIKFLIISGFDIYGLSGLHGNINIVEIGNYSYINDLARRTC